jgi:hypothetical protein
LRPLRLYAVLSTLAQSAVSPFISFFSASEGVNGELLALVSSAGTTLPGVTQYALVKTKMRAKTMISTANLIMSSLWITTGVLGVKGSLFVPLYLGIQAALGVANFGWLLIMEKVSVTTRGQTLALYSFYANLGGLVATLLTGFVIRDDLLLMRYFFVVSGMISLFNSYVISKSDVDSSYAPSTGSSGLWEIRRFLVANFIFMLTWSMSWPLFPIAQVYKFHMNGEEVAILNVLGGASTVAVQRAVGRLTDRHRKWVMFFGRLGLASFPLGYALCTSVYQLYLMNLISGFTNSAMISFTSYVFDNCTNKRKAIAFYNMLNGIGALIGSTIGGVEYSIASSYLGEVEGVTLALLIAGACRIATSMLYLGVKEEGRKVQATEARPVSPIPK